ncbi:MAG: methyltransferase domain-containing protein, partial [Candidatus Aenigmarchaeota archaeon]|nr:methyltransferase domain-containing protein [Candidatus Aenigmarchaeota archaeon]
YLEENAALVGGVGESLPFKDGSCGLVFSVMSLHHISNIEDVLMEVVRVLKDDGKFIVVDWTPSASKLMNQPPSHFLSVDVFKSTVDSLELSCQIEEFPIWYISEVQKI